MRAQRSLPLSPRLHRSSPVLPQLAAFSKHYPHRPPPSDFLSLVLSTARPSTHAGRPGKEEGGGSRGMVEPLHRTLRPPLENLHLRPTPALSAPSPPFPPRSNTPWKRQNTRVCTKPRTRVSDTRAAHAFPRGCGVGGGGTGCDEEGGLALGADRHFFGSARGPCFERRRGAPRLPRPLTSPARTLTCPDIVPRRQR
eukprot:67865-Rhodomonas_salina.1